MNTLPTARPLFGWELPARPFGCFCGRGPRRRSHQVFAVTGRASVRVDTNDGSVRVTSGDSKQVEFRVDTRATSWERISASTPGKAETRSS